MRLDGIWHELINFGCQLADDAVVCGHPLLNPAKIRGNINLAIFSQQRQNCLPDLPVIHV
jgi:hypothetical protein